MGGGPDSRIVRISRAAWPAVAGGAVLASLVLAAPRDAWLPFAPGPASAEAWAMASPGWDWLVRAQVDLGAWLRPSDAVTGPVLVAMTLSAAAVAVLAHAIRRTGLSAPLAALLAVVGGAAPLSVWQASSPLGAAPASLASACLLEWLVRHLSHGTRRERPAWATVIVLGPLLVGLEAVARLRHGSTAGTPWGLVTSDLGWPGLVLLLPTLGLIARGAIPTVRVWQGLAVLVLATSPLPPAVRAAVVLPWAWWLVGAGLSALLDLRGSHASRWAAAGLAIWIGLHAARVPWGHQRQQAALTRTWADGVAARIDSDHPLVEDASARGRLLEALVRHRHAGHPGPPVVPNDEARVTTRGGRQPVVTSPQAFEALRWEGLAFEAWVDHVGSPLDGVLGRLPRGTVILAAISAESASRLTPAQWQALGRMGLRLQDAASPRAHALVGMTGARGAALESAQGGDVRLDVQPGDPIGRTGVRSPVDARLDAGPSRVSVWLRGVPLVQDADGLALVFFSTRGDLLAWRVGRLPSDLSGPSLGRSPSSVARAVEALPCLDTDPGIPVDVTTLTTTGALGLTWRTPGRLDVTITRPPGARGRKLRLARETSTAAWPQLMRSGDGLTSLSMEGRGDDHGGLWVGGPVVQARATTHGTVRLCAAWPMPYAVSLGRGPAELLASPRDESHFGAGWHDSEREAEGRHFRWMDGPRADLLVAFPDAASFTVTLDAESPDAPDAHDEVRLAINGHDLGARPLLPTRHLYSWQVEIANARRGMNTLTLTTTRTMRPADRTPGGDPRELGLLLRRWSVSGATPRPTPP
jgi:hypothetical protein